MISRAKGMAQKKKSYKFLLTPVDASRNFLQFAYLLSSNFVFMDLFVCFILLWNLILLARGTWRNSCYWKQGSAKNDLEEVQKLLVSAAGDCVPQDRNSLVVLQSKTGVEVCAFQLILKNASSLLDDKDPIKLEAGTKLSDLIQSFTSFSGRTREGDVPLTSITQRVVLDLRMQ